MTITRADRSAMPSTRELLLVIFWVTSGLSTLALAAAWALAVLAHFEFVPYNPLWLSLCSFLALPSAGLWVAAWLIRHPAGSPRR